MNLLLTISLSFICTGFAKAYHESLPTIDQLYIFLLSMIVIRLFWPRDKDGRML